jgi:signal transduction histidine kinase
MMLRNNKEKQKANLVLKKQKQEMEIMLEKLTSAQKQLVQSEKMASLGELTAGIAHEIQNPLNFVNNFSELNQELIAELNAERLKPLQERNEDVENEILNDIRANEEKIAHHGKRADAIVKGMLQHSRTSTGQRESTDINALCEEYLRLAYHGLKAKDNSFHAGFKTDFDPAAGSINLVPQDIGRVLLNLINNAFYAVQEKANQHPAGYEPMVTVATKRLNHRVEITVSDNGNGIPDSIRDKIFQPFFTTKPTGQGTGLGLSLSYDIVKAHGGELLAESRVDHGTVFIIHLNM